MKKYCNRVLVFAMFMLFLWIKLIAQPPITWEKTYGGDSGDKGYAVQETFDGGYIVAGYARSFIKGREVWDVFLVKTNSSGDEQWHKRYGGGWTDEGYAVEQTSDTGYIITGYTIVGSYDHDLYLVKTDSLGNELWSETYGETGQYYYDLGYSVRQTSDGGYIVAGYKATPGAGEKDVYLVKTNSSGVAQWTKTYGGPDDDEGKSVDITSDGGYIIAGYKTVSAKGPTDIYLLKTGSNGDTLWTKTYDRAGNDYGNAVQQTFDGGYIIAGETDLGAGSGGRQIYLIKTDENGDTLWTQIYGGDDIDIGRSVEQTSDSGYVITGDRWESGDVDAYVLRTNKFGDSLWAMIIGGLQWDNGEDVRETSDDGYIVAGCTRSSGNYDVYLIKLGGTVGIELSSFTAYPSGDGIVLTWRSESESSLAQYFLIRRTEGEEPYQEIARFPGQGTTPCQHNYRYVDREVQSGTVYAYKLGAVDHNGDVIWYGPVYSSMSRFDGIIFRLLSCNPCEEDIRFSCYFMEPHTLEVEVRNAAGRLIDTVAKGLFQAGEHSFVWDTKTTEGEKVPNGIYFILLRGESSLVTRKVLLIR